MQKIIGNNPLRLTDFQNQFRKNMDPPIFAVSQHDLKSYDQLSQVYQEVANG